MGKRVTALVEPAMLVWARESAGYSVDEAARRASVKPQRLAEWEKGTSRLTVNQLRKLGRIYKRPLAVFYLPDPPKDFQPLKDFRRLPREVPERQSPQLRYEMRRAQDRREIALELFDSLDAEPPKFSLKVTQANDSERVASEIRELLGITYDKQVSWKPDYETFYGWRNALENAGILVFQALGIDVSEMRGFSVAETPLPTIAVNIRDSVRGRTFTMLHEVAHIAIQDGGLCAIEEEGRQIAGTIEAYCNRVAGATLIPIDHILHEDVVVSKGSQKMWEENEIHILAEKYGVSREALLRRLLVLGRTTEQFYRQKRSQYIRDYRKWASREKKGFAPIHKIAVSSAGHTFVKLVLENYRLKNITAVDVADFLDIRLKHLERIESEVYGVQGRTLLQS